MSHLTSGAINVGMIRDLGRRALIDALDTVGGKKALVLDPKVSGPLGLISEYSLLKDHGVENIYHLQAGRLDTPQRNVVYICRPKMILMKYIADHIHIHSKAGETNKQYFLFFVPRRSLICERVLEEEGVFGGITINSLNVDLVPTDSDLLSLEIDSSFREFFLEGDRTSLYYVARSLMGIQSLFGVIPRIYGKGQCARVVADMMLRMRREVAAEESVIAPEIDSVVLIDRTVDPITPMLQQLTYEGLIDEVFGIQNTHVDLEPAITGHKERRKIPLNSGDSLFAHIRDRNFAVIGPILNKSAKRINDEYEERHAAKTVSQIRDFVGKLSTIQQEHLSLRIHTNIAEQIMHHTREPEFHRRLEVEQNLINCIDSSMNTDYIEELIHRQEPFAKVMRLLCLYSAVNNGVKPKLLESLKRDILQTYGYEKMFTLNNLERIGLLKKAENKNPYPQVRKSLRLTVEDVDEKEPNDIAYTFSGYAPLSVRLVQQLHAKGGWKAIDDVLRLLPGPTVEEVQQLPAGLQPKKSFGATTSSKTTLVYFLGGCTYAEIAALRFLEAQSEGQREFVIATTKLINGDTLIDSIIEPIDNRLV